MALLQELEEQKKKLEQMLLEAQQERKKLEATVTQEVPADQPDEPVQDQEVTSVSPGSATEVKYQLRFKCFRCRCPFFTTLYKTSN